MATPASGATVAVIGAGLGGCALVAGMGLSGYRMRLHDLDDARLKDIRDRGGIEVDGLFQGFAAVEMATPELAPAVDGADIIAVCTGSNAHAEVARLLAPRLRDGQTILLVQGGTGGSLVVRNALGRHGCAADVDVCEMDNYPFSLAWPRPTSMSFTIRKEWLQIAALPAARGPAVVAKLRAAFPQAVAAPNTLYTGLNNANGDPARRQHGVQYRPARDRWAMATASTRTAIRRAPSPCWSACAPSASPSRGPSA